MQSVQKKLNTVFLLGFLVALELAFTSYVNSSFLSLYVGEKSVSLLYVASSILAILGLFFTPKLLLRLGEFKFLAGTAAIVGIALFGLAYTHSILLAVPLFMVYFALNYLIIFALDELVQMCGKHSVVGRMRGLYLTTMNLAWVISQVVVGFIISNFSFFKLYLIAGIIMVIFLAITSLIFRKLKDPKYDKTVAWSSVRRFFKNKNLTRAYKINFLLQFFYSWMVIYTPIYLYQHMLFSWQEISIIFAIMLLPFVLIEFPLGRYSDRVGEKGMLMLGFAVAAIATFALYLTKSREVWVWAILLFSTRIGAAIIEVMSDVYFFKHVTEENDELIAVYRNTSPFSYILGPALGFIALSFLPAFNYLYAVLAGIMLLGIYFAGTIKKNDI